MRSSTTGKFHGSFFRVHDCKNLIHRGRRLALHYAGLFFGFAFFGLQAAAGIETIAKIFICTKQSTTPRMAYKRYLLNAVHTSAWYTNELKPNSEAWTSFEIIQNYHRRAGKICKRHNAGFINQKDLAMTQFLLIGMFCLDGFVKKVDDKDFLDATMHCWRTFGHFLGIKDEFNICAGTWDQCRPRFQIAMDRIIKPVLENPVNSNYEVLVKPMIEGLRPMNLFWTYDACLFINKWLAGCDNCQYFESDYKEGVQVKEKFLEYNKLSWYDKLYVSQLCWSVYLSHRFIVFRYILNVVAIIANIFFFNLPLLGMWRYGYKWAYVRMNKPHGV